MIWLLEGMKGYVMMEERVFVDRLSQLLVSLTLGKFVQDFGFRISDFGFWILDLGWFWGLGFRGFNIFLHISDAISSIKR